MEERLCTDTTDQPQAIDAADAVSHEYVGRWNRLVSTTNWEKGRIIAAWRAELAEAGAPPASYSDEAWSRQVGGVSAQHVGRLRRVHDRFGESQQQYGGLYWSHFFAALDWPDAEMWLEGAVQSGWSISEMRRQRWQALGAPDGLAPRDEDIVEAELDEDANPANEAPTSQALAATIGEVHPSTDDEPAETEDGFDALDALVGASSEASEVDERPEPADPIRPFENLPALPADLAEALESMKLAILHHKLSGWAEIAQGDVLAALDGLRQLALAPADL